MTWLKGKCRGPQNGNAKLSDDAVWEIRRARQGAGRRLKDDPRSCEALARKFGVSPQIVSKIARGDRWGHHLEYRPT